MENVCNWFFRLTTETRDDDKWISAFQSCQAAVASLNEVSQNLKSNITSYSGTIEQVVYLQRHVLVGFRDITVQDIMTHQRANIIADQFSGNRRDDVDVYQAALFAGNSMEQCISLQLFGGDIKSEEFRNVLLIGLYNHFLPHDDQKSELAKSSVLAAIRDSRIDEPVALMLIEEALRISNVPLDQIVQGCQTFIDYCATKPANSYTPGVPMADAAYFMTNNCLVEPESILLKRLGVPSDSN